MHEQTAVIDTADGPMDALIAHPDGEGPFAAVIIFQHIGGLSPTMRAMARRVAEGGFYCIVPGLFHRLGSIVIEPLSTDPTVAAIRSIAVASLRPPTVLMDIEATIAFLAGEPRVRPGPLGAMGYGGGAGLAMLAAGSLPERFGALISILGVGFRKDGPDTPHHLLPRMRAEAYCGFAGNDEIIPAAVVSDLRTLFDDAGTKAKIVVHPGVRHGYPFPGRPVYDATAAERDWDAVFEIFRRRLPAA